MLEIMRALLVALISLAAVSTVAGQATPTPEAIARAVQDRYQKVRDFSAEFSQTYRGGVLRTETREQGTMAIKKPGRMRWIYTKPDHHEFISDGSKIYVYLPAEKQVIVSRVPPDDQATTSALFLSGKGDIARDFTPAFIATPIPGTIALKLTPRRHEPDYEYLVVIADPATLQIRGLTTRDRQRGESTITFTNLKENQGISDKEFVFRTPRGVDVVSNDDASN
jgi:outer membrane lipoprotein carrier protein